MKQSFFETWLKPSFRTLQNDCPIFTMGYNGQPDDLEITEHFSAMSTADKQKGFLYACPPFKPTPSLATDLLHPYHKSVSPGNVLGIPASGAAYVSASFANGSSGGPVFAYPIQASCFDALVQGGKADLNANIIIPTTHPTFKDSWKQLELKLRSD